jgi:hypothetical protein
MVRNCTIIAPYVKLEVLGVADSLPPHPFATPFLRRPALRCHLIRRHNAMQNSRYVSRHPELSRLL